MIKPLLVARGLFLLNAAIWLAFGVANLIRMKNDGSVSPLILLIVAILLFVNSGAMLVAAWGIGTRAKLFYYFALLLLVGNIILTFTDEFGTLDFITLLLDFVLLGVLIFYRKVFLRSGGYLKHPPN